MPLGLGGGREERKDREGEVGRGELNEVASSM